MTQEQRDYLKSFAPPRHANMHNVDTFVDLDHLINYATMKHKLGATDANAHGNADEDGGSELLAYMVGQKSSCGDV
jgi:hypothetical protein